MYMVQKWGRGPITKAILCGCDSLGLSVDNDFWWQTVKKGGNVNGKRADHEMCEWPHLSAAVA